MKWRSILRLIIQDYAMTGFGAWIIWKQVYTPSPNGYLALIGFACMFPAARTAVLTILSIPGSSSSLPPGQEESSQHSSQQGSSGEKTANGE